MSMSHDVLQSRRRIGRSLLAEQACAWGGLACLNAFFLALLSAGFIPIPPPSLNIEEVVALYRENATGIRVGMGFMLVSGMFWVLFAAAISGQMRRIPGVSHTLVYAQLAGGSFACIAFLMPAVFFSATAFRPERPAELIHMMNDLSWIMTVMPWPPLMAQFFAFAGAILSDSSEQRLFPRWLGFMILWMPIVLMPATMVSFFKSGPFAWSGLFTFWIPGVAFGLSVAATTYYLLRAIRSPLEHVPESTSR